jgi:predicted negative regulator of RcsB-dependent stress response
MISPNHHRAILAGAIFLITLYSCAPQRVYRIPVPPSSSSTPVPGAIPAPAPPPPLALPEAARNPLPQEAKIREQDIRAKTPSPTPTKDAKEPARQASVRESRTAPETTSAPPPLADDTSLLAKITTATSPQRAASLRLTEEGRKILDAGDPSRALTRLEKTIVIDSTNPYGYFYLAKAQYRLGRFRESHNFLDLAESRLGAEPFWLAEIHALRGENFRAQGQLQRAEASYSQAVRINSGNRTASDALARMQGDAQSAQPATK